MYYNLLMSHQDNLHWEEGCLFNFPCSRFLEFTDEKIKKQFMNYPDKLKEYPCLFTHEGEPKEGIVGNILSISKDKNDLKIRCDFRNSIPPLDLDNDMLQALDIGSNFLERNRQYWAIKKVNFYEVALEAVCKKYPRLLSRVELKDIWKKITLLGAYF